jgi:hypothetical protein
LVVTGFFDDLSSNIDPIECTIVLKGIYDDTPLFFPYNYVLTLSVGVPLWLLFSMLNIKPSI